METSPTLPIAAGAVPAGLLASERAEAAFALGRARATRVLEKRQRRREQIHDRVLHPIDTPQAMRDPLDHRVSPLRSTLNVARLLAIAVLVHMLIGSVFLAANAVLGGDTEYRPPERVSVRIIQPPPPPPLPPPLPEEEETVSEAPPRPEAKPKPREARKKRPRPEPVVPPPVEQATPPEQAPKRRVVGLDLSSTVAGSGPAFATGSTRMGETERVAKDPERAARAPAAPEPRPGNRVATRLPLGNAVVVRPRRVFSPDPTYPPLLRKQEVEADVVLVVSIEATGEVSKVQVIRPAREAEFNEAAISSARASRWKPATRGGKPFSTTQRYTVRFRLND